jgi:hypothetical protein
MEHITFILSIRTRSENNMHGHWRGHAARAKSQRSATYEALKGIPFSKDDLSHANVSLVRVSPRELDGDNLQGALKAIRDGITDWMSGGLNESNKKGGVNDRDPRIHWLYAQQRGNPKEYSVIIDVRWEEGMATYVEEKYQGLDTSIAVEVKAFLCLECYQVTGSLRGTTGAVCDGCGQKFIGVKEMDSDGDPRLFEKADSIIVQENPSFECSSD